MKVPHEIINDIIIGFIIGIMTYMLFDNTYIINIFFILVEIILVYIVSFMFCICVLILEHDRLKFMKKYALYKWVDRLFILTLVLLVLLIIVSILSLNNIVIVILFICIILIYRCTWILYKLLRLCKVI